MELKKVTIGYLSNAMQTGIIEKGYTLCKIERRDMGQKLCIIDNNKAVDINDFSNEYEIVKRDDNHRIAPDQTIKEEVLYALDLEEVSKETQKKFKKRVKCYKKLNH